MSKPSIAELLTASGYTDYTPEMVSRAMTTLYGNIGANLDERNWSAIMQSSNPLVTAEAGLQGMYQDNGFLTRNTEHLVQAGYMAAQAEVTYRQMAERLGTTYTSSWSVGTAYESLGDMTYGQLVALVPVVAVEPTSPLPTLSVASTATGFTVSLNVAGTVQMSDSGDLGDFAAGTTVLTEQTSIQQGFLTLSSSGNTSAASSPYVVLGTAVGDRLDASKAGNQVDYIFGGAGDDEITGGGGADVLFAGAGYDRFFVEESDDVVAGEIYDGGEGYDRLLVFASANFTGVTAINAIEKIYLGYDVSVVFDAATLTGQTITIDHPSFPFSSFDTSTVTINGTDSAETISLGGITNNNNSSNEIAQMTNGLTINGLGGDDTIIGSARNDAITGGAGSDTLNGGAGQDTYRYAAASDSTINNEASLASGFDTVSITSGDIFDFAVDVTAVLMDQYYVGQTPQANGDALLAQLDDYYQSAPPSTGVDAMFISIGGAAKGSFLVIDVDNNDQITSNDLIIEIVGITSNMNIQLSLTGGNVVMQEVYPVAFA